MRSILVSGRVKREVVVPDRTHVVRRVRTGIAVKIDQVVNVGHDRRTTLRQRPRRVERLTRLQQQQVHECVDRKAACIALVPSTTAGEIGLDLREGAATREARDYRVAELSGEGLSFRNDRATWIEIGASPMWPSWSL